MTSSEIEVSIARARVVNGALDLHHTVTVDELYSRLDAFEAAVRRDALTAARDGDQVPQ